MTSRHMSKSCCIDLRVHVLDQAEEKNKRDKFTMSVSCSPDGRKIACGSQDGAVCIFDSESGALLHSLEGHYKPVRSLSFTPGPNCA